MNGVIYARYSSHHQTERSIEGQVDDCVKYAKSKGIRIIETYVDRAQTGTNDNRDGFQRMLEDSKKELFDCVLVWKIDRFGRNREELAFNKRKLRKNNVRLLSVMEHIPDGPEGIIMESLLEGLAEYYSANLAQNVKRGMNQNAEKCKVNGGTTPFGYKIRDGAYAIDSDRAPIVKEIFERYAAGEPAKVISDLLNARNVKTVTKKEFTNKSIAPIIQNEKYRGLYHYNGIKIENGFPRIVSDELFYKAQRIREETRLRKSPKKKKYVYTLSGKVYCAKCKSPYIADCGTSSSGKLISTMFAKGKRKSFVMVKRLEKQP